MALLRALLDVLGVICYESFRCVLSSFVLTCLKLEAAVSSTHIHYLPVDNLKAVIGKGGHPQGPACLPYSPSPFRFEGIEVSAIVCIDGFISVELVVESMRCPTRASASVLILDGLRGL